MSTQGKHCEEVSRIDDEIGQSSGLISSLDVLRGQLCIPANLCFFLYLFPICEGLDRSSKRRRDELALDRARFQVHCSLGIHIARCIAACRSPRFLMSLR